MMASYDSVYTATRKRRNLLVSFGYVCRRNGNWKGHHSYLELSTLHRDRTRPSAPIGCFMIMLRLAGSSSSVVVIESPDTTSSNLEVKSKLLEPSSG